MEGERLISLVVVIEARPGISDLPSPAPWPLPVSHQAGSLLWRPAVDLEMRGGRGPEELVWQPQPGRRLNRRRTSSEHGLLLPLGEADAS